MTLESGLGAASARAPFEAGYFGRARRDQAVRAEGAAVSLDSAGREAAAPPVPPVDPSAHAGEDEARRAPELRSGQLLSFDAIAALQGEAEDGGGDPGGGRPGGLEEAERAEVRALEKADREVRAHERAHTSAGGELAGQPSFSFETGPDGQRYAIAGEVPIDVSPVAGDPRATIQKADQVRRAALAPAEPSSQDRQVAAAAEALRRQGQVELRDQRAAERVDAPARAEAAPPASPPGSEGEPDIGFGPAAGIGGDLEAAEEAGEGPPRAAARAGHGFGAAGRDEGVSGFSAFGRADPPDGLRESAFGAQSRRPDDEARRALGAGPPANGIPDGTLIDAAVRARPGATLDVRV